ncbi:hypothetical protein K2Z84_20740 [Candidatus Binatia bacterium]|nr:hypothetical protein [Candidatus Binatia bacterium]
MTAARTEDTDERRRAPARHADRRRAAPATLLTALLAACALGSGLILLVSMRSGGSSALIVGDGKAYYAWARSALVDHDLDFGNDYRLLYPPDPLPDEAEARTPIGRVPNKYPVGLALVEAPGVLLADLLAHVVPGATADGASWPYQVVVAGWLVALELLGVLLLFRAMVRLGAAPTWAAASSAVLLAGTNLIHYVAKEPAMAHGAGIALFGIALYVAAGWPDRWSGVGLAGRLLFGALLGLLVLVRNSNVVLLPLLGWAAVRKRGVSTAVAPIVASCALILLLQPLSLYLLWGDLRLHTYPSEGFTADRFGVWNTLFSTRHGLFVYHPWYLVLVVLNCLALSRGPRTIAALALSSFAGLVVINGTWWCWWFGASFGNRAFVESLAPMTVGASLFVSRSRNPRRTALLCGAAAVAAILSNVDLWLGYLLHRYPHDGGHGITDAYLWFVHPPRP